MNPKTILLLAIALVACGIFFLWPSDEKEIRGSLSSLAEYCSSADKEPVMESLQKAALAAKLCTDPCKIHIESPNIDHDFNQKEIIDRILMMKKRLPNVRFSFHDTIVEISDDNKAQVLTTLRLTGETFDERFTDAYEINITVEKQDGDWRFASFNVVEFMKK